MRTRARSRVWPPKLLVQNQVDGSTHFYCDREPRRRKVWAKVKTIVNFEVPVRHVNLHGQ